MERKSQIIEEVVFAKKSLVKGFEWNFEDLEDDKDNDNNIIKESSNVSEGKENVLESANSDEIVNCGDKKETIVKDNDVLPPGTTNTNVVESTLSNKPSTTNVNTDVNNAITLSQPQQQQQPIVNSTETTTLPSSQPNQLKPTFIATTNIEFHFSIFRMQVI